MWEPPYGTPGQGRYNVAGLGVLYTSDKFEGAVSEVQDTHKEAFDLMEIRLIESVKILDLAKKDYPLFKYCKFPANTKFQNKPEYLIPNFIAQCCQLLGIQAIRYKSATHAESINYVFFDYSRSWFKFIKSHIYEQIDSWYSA